MTEPVDRGDEPAVDEDDDDLLDGGRDEPVDAHRRRADQRHYPFGNDP